MSVGYGPPAREGNVVEKETRRQNAVGGIMPRNDSTAREGASYTVRKALAEHKAMAHLSPAPWEKASHSPPGRAGTVAI